MTDIRLPDTLTFGRKLHQGQLANVAAQAKAVLGVDKLKAVADRGSFSGEEIVACHKAGIAVTLPKPMTSGIEARGRFWQAGLRRYWTDACRHCALKHRCITRWEHEHVLEAVQKRLDENPLALRQRRETVEPPWPDCL